MRALVGAAAVLLVPAVLAAPTRAQTTPLLQLQGHPYSQGAMTLHLTAGPGVPSLLLYGLNPLDPPVQTTKGPFYVGTVFNVIFAGMVPPEGRIDLAFAMPPLDPIFAGIPMVMQGLVPGSLTNPATLPLDQPYYVPAEAEVLSSPTPSVTGLFGDRVATGDLNGDGELDVVVGAWFEHSGGVEASGRVHVFWGPELDSSTTLEPLNPIFYGLFGCGVYVADFDGDSIADLVVSEGPGDPSPLTEPARLYVYRGGGRFSTTPEAVVESVDVGPGQQSFGHFGVVADVSHDGVPDIVIGTPSMTVQGLAKAGRLEIHLGPAFEESFVVTAPDLEVNGFFGSRVNSGDFNGDGIVDLVVSAPQKMVNGVQSIGRVYLLTGPSLSHYVTIDHPEPAGINTRFGNSVAGADLNGDGIDDVVATDERNRVYVFWSPTFESFTRFYRPPDPVTGTAISGSFGYFATVGDVNSDGLDDIVIADPFAAGMGRVYVALGPYFASFLVLVDKEPEALGEFGWGVHLSDIDQNGRVELLVGSDTADQGGVPNSGRVTILRSQ